MSKDINIITSLDGAKAQIRYTTVTNGNGDIVMRYFAVPLDITNLPFVAGFFTREEAVQWWENSSQSEKRKEMK